MAVDDAVNDVSIVAWTNRAVDITGGIAFRLGGNLLADIYATPADTPPAA